MRTVWSPHDDELPRLDHGESRCLSCSLEFLRLALGIVGTPPRGEGELQAQLKTAAMSVPLNIAEGAGNLDAGLARQAKALVAQRGDAEQDVPLTHAAHAHAHAHDARSRCTITMHDHDARSRCTITMHDHDARSRCTILLGSGAFPFARA
jgi:hypothetical protein